MAGPPNPFASLQKDGPVVSARGGRGTGVFGRQSPYQAKNGGGTGAAPPRDSRGRGRGRGTSTRGRGRGAAAGNGLRNKEGQAVVEAGSNLNSPFAQLRGNAKPFSPSPSPSPFGQPAQSASSSPSHFGGSPFSGLAKGAGSFGAPSGFDGTMVDSSRDPRRRAKPTTTNGTGSVPVEDASILNSYNDRYEQLKLDRAKEREQAIRQGLMADPNQPTSLNQAITPVGTCTSMCPEFERVERIVQKMVDKSEKFLHPSSNSLQNMETKMLKRFRRSAAGYDEQLPSDIRTPKTLLQTMNYLIRHVIGGPEPLGIIHKFVWDRTRSIRNDFSVQQVTQEDHVKLAVTSLERIARFHILSLHLLSSPANEEPFDRHQEREQLNNTMLSLLYYYDDNRGRISFPNEDEFRAYYIIFSIHDQRPDLEARLQKWPAELRNSPKVQVALELFAAAGNAWEYQGTLDSKRPNAIAQGFYARFFSLLDSPAVSYLMACVAEIYFNHMRQTAIRSIWKGYCRSPASQQHKNEEWTVDELTKVLCFDDDDQTIKFCEEQDLEVAENDNGELYLNWGSRPVDSVAFQPSSEHSFSENIVESKRAGRTLPAVILGLNVKEAANLGMIDSSLLEQRSLALPAPKIGADNDDALFVSDDDNEMPSIQGNGDVRGESPDSDASFRNGFGFSQPTTEPANAGFPQPSVQPSEPSPAPSVLSGFPQPESQPSQPVQPANPFTSLFPSSSTGQFGAPPSNLPTPFSNTPTPSSFSFPKPNEPAQPASKTGLFSTPPPQQPSPFSSGPSIFSQKPETSAPAPSSTPQFQLPSLKPTTSPAASPFGTPPAPATTSDNAGLTAGQPPSNLFAAKPPFSGISSPFSFAQDKAKEVEVQKPAEAKPAEKPAEPVSLFKPNGLAEQKEAGKPSIFQPAAEPKPVGTLFHMPSVQPPVVDKPSEQETPQPDSVTQQEISPPAQIVAPTAPAVPEPAVPAVSVTTAEPALGTEELVKPAREEPVPEEKPISPGVTERRNAWIETLRETAIKRRQEITASRKRVHEEQPEQEPEDSGHKASKMLKPEPAPRKPSMALSSIKPLPKLPILEQIESLTARKPTPEKTEPPKPSQIDEDEILLSAARIAAESLRSGPKLVNSTPAYFEPRRQSFSPRSSFSSSLPPLSRSLSPQSHSHGYDVAFAPDNDLGLGRTLSRTEQRLRLTGGKGLAYKPLDFTPEKKRGRK